MPSQLRVYKIKPDRWDPWLKFFDSKVIPLHRAFGIPVRIAWMNREAGEFIWVRDFAADKPVHDQEQSYVSWDERQRVIGDESKLYIESMDVRIVDLVYDATPSSPSPSSRD